MALQGDAVQNQTELQALADSQLTDAAFIGTSAIEQAQAAAELARRAGQSTALQSLNIALPNPFGGDRSNSTDANPNNPVSAVRSTASAASGGDLRVRLSPQIDAQDVVYGENTPSNILTPLRSTVGLLFPYTPTISYSQSVDYRALEMVHTNQDFHYYGRSPSLELTVAGDFTVQNYREGQYVLACLHFLRTVSKMYFGKSDPTNAGLPPPVLIFNGYGNYMFNNLRVIVKNHSYNLEKNVDYITVKTADGVARLPAWFQLTVQLIVQNTPNKWRSEFDLNKFRTGELMRSKTGWI